MRRRLDDNGTRKAAERTFRRRRYRRSFFSYADGSIQTGPDARADPTKSYFFCAAHFFEQPFSAALQFGRLDHRRTIPREAGSCRGFLLGQPHLYAGRLFQRHRRGRGRRHRAAVRGEKIRGYAPRRPYRPRVCDRRGNYFDRLGRGLHPRAVEMDAHARRGFASIRRVFPRLFLRGVSRRALQYLRRDFAGRGRQPPSLILSHFFRLSQRRSGSAFYRRVSYGRRLGGRGHRDFSGRQRAALSRSAGAHKRGV